MKKNWAKLYMETHYRGILAGMLIGFGVLINIQTSPPALGACLFSFGLLTVIKLQVPLYTGKVGYVLNNYKRLPWILINNILGICVLVGGYITVNPTCRAALRAAALIKFSKSYVAFLLYAFFCGMLIHFAVKCNHYIITIMAVMIFILIGAEHCIADMAYFLILPSFKNFIKIIITIIGNSMGAIFVETCDQIPYLEEGDTKCATLD